MRIFTTYILYSESIQMYYVGSTGDTMEGRIRRHNSNHSGFTGKTNDWKVIYEKEFTLLSEARKFERRIKKRGAARYLASMND